MVDMESFTLDKIADYKMFYLLKNIKASNGPVNLVHQAVEETTSVDQDKYDVYRIGDDDLVVAFKNVFEHVGKYNYTATNGSQTEFVGLQPFERIHDFYLTDNDDPQLGVFVFIDSQPATLPGQDWRCDHQLYGPRMFTAVGESNQPFLSEGSRISIYESVVGVNGVGHIAYFKIRDDDELRPSFVNQAVLPLTGVTLPEIVKLILEWSIVSSEPFSNTEPIATKAASFVRYFDIQESMVNGQPDMQVFEFLKGNPSARMRPTGQYAMSPQLRSFIESSVSYMTFSQLLAHNPGYFDLREAVATEKQFAVADWEESLTKFRVFEPQQYGDVESVCEYIAGTLPGTLGFVRNYFTLLAKKKGLLENIPT